MGFVARMTFYNIWLALRFDFHSFRNNIKWLIEDLRTLKFFQSDFIITSRVKAISSLSAYKVKSSYIDQVTCRGGKLALFLCGWCFFDFHDRLQSLETNRLLWLLFFGNNLNWVCSVVVHDFITGLLVTFLSFLICLASMWNISLAVSKWVSKIYISLGV